MTHGAGTATPPLTIERLAWRCLALGLAGLGTCLAVAATAYTESQRATWESPFVQRILQGPFDAAGIRKAALLLQVSGHDDAARRLIETEQQRVLAALVGDPFDVPRSIGEAIARHPAAGPGAAARTQEGVRVDPPGPGLRRTSPVPEGYRRIGENVWAEERPGVVIVQALYVVHNGLRAPIDMVQIRFQSPDTRPDYSDDPHFVCTADGTEAFAPGVAQAAICEGPMSGKSAVLDAVAKRSAPLRTQGIGTPEIMTADGYMYPRDRSPVQLDAARETVMAATCEDKGTCGAVGSAETREGLKRHAHELLLAFAALAAVASFAVAARVKPGVSSGGVPWVAAVAMIIFALLEIAAMWTTVRPGASYEGLLTAAFVLYSALPYLALLSIVGTTLVFGRATRLVAFAAVFGALVGAGIAALVWLTVNG